MDQRMREVQVKTNFYASLVDKTIERIETLSGHKPREVGFCLHHLQRLMRTIRRDRHNPGGFTNSSRIITAQNCRELIEESMQFINAIFPGILSRYSAHVCIEHQGLLYFGIEEFIALQENMLMNVISLLGGSGEIFISSEDIYLKQTPFVHFEFKVPLRDRDKVALLPQALRHCAASCQKMRGYLFTRCEENTLTYSCLIPTLS